MIPAAKGNTMQTLSFTNLQTNYKEFPKSYNLHILYIGNILVTLTFIFPENCGFYNLERPNIIFLCSPQWIPQNRY